ncbi:hypothetical protein WMY93_016016 [Mugilogobius chulae]|uniref:Protein tyrosine phosphatase domain-containing protein 1 n=1 Tax=Mugilogobius chulae TaxID=88201 RepID=A0AAW0NWF2_9GOBI
MSERLNTSVDLNQEARDTRELMTRHKLLPAFNGYKYNHEEEKSNNHTLFFLPGVLCFRSDIRVADLQAQFAHLPSPLSFTCQATLISHLCAHLVIHSTPTESLTAIPIGRAMAAGVSLVNDLPLLTAGVHSGADSGANSADMEMATERIPTAKYTKMGETLRHVIPGHMQCSMACGGRACKYENPSRWSDEEQAIKGLYSSWITDNLLAMARPSTEIIEKYNIIEQFRRCGLKTVINLQRPGEHASCGNPLEQESGFTYRPEIFMEAGIYYYNFGWKDYGVASLTTILDMVKVMSFAVQEGKMAIHCHAGLGRTGVLVACYLVFTSRMSADQAILFVRAKRPNSIQTRGQLLCVREFAQFLIPLRSVFSCTEPKTSPVTLSQYLTRQRHLLHGYEARQLKHVPKIVQLVCQLLTDIANNRQAEVEEQWLEIPDLTAEVEKTVSQQALQQLGNEMRGKGIPVSPCLSHMPSPGLLQTGPLEDLPLISDNELDWSIPVRLSLSTSKGLSYSDSVLHKLTCDKLFLESVHKRAPLNFLVPHSLSHSSLIPCNQPTSSDLLCQNFSNNLQMPEPQAQNDAQSPFLKKRLLKGHQSLSLDLSEPVRTFYSNYTNPASEQGVISNVFLRKGHLGDVPLISLQSELSPDSRRLLVAKALAMDLEDQDWIQKFQCGRQS